MHYDVADRLFEAVGAWVFLATAAGFGGGCSSPAPPSERPAAAIFGQSGAGEVGATNCQNVPDHLGFQTTVSAPHWVGNAKEVQELLITQAAIMDQPCMRAGGMLLQGAVVDDGKTSTATFTCVHGTGL